MTQKELTVIAVQYLGTDRDVVYATADGNFFYLEHLCHGQAHAKTNNIELFKITKGDILAAKKESEANVKAAEKAAEKEREKAKEKKAEIKKEAKAKKESEANVKAAEKAAEKEREKAGKPKAPKKKKTTSKKK